MVRKYAITEDEFLGMHIDPADGHLKTVRDNGDPVDFGNAMGPAVTDADMATILTTPGSASAAHLNASFVKGGRADWMPAGSNVDPVTGAFNANPVTLLATRKAIARARTGGEPFHVSVLGDSIMDHNGPGEPRGVTSAPARLHDALCRRLGFVSAGTGIVTPWIRWIPASGVGSHPGNEPRLFYQNTAGKITNTTFGMYQGGVSLVSDGAGAAFIGMEPGIEYDELWVYTIGSANRTHIHVNTLPVDDAAFTTTGLYFQGSGYPGHSTTPTNGATWVDNEPGYIRAAPGVNSGMVVLRIPLPSKDAWNVRVWGNTAYLAGLDARDTDGQVLVTNFALVGMKLADLVWNGDDVSGYRGLPYAINVPIADLVIQELHINDWQAHGSVETYKTNLRNTIDRQRSTAPAGTYGQGTGPGGDLILFINAQPNYANFPPDHVQTPALTEFFAAVYEVAIEKGVAVVDNAWRSDDYATSSGFSRDGLHPNNMGADDIATAIAATIASVA